MLSYLSCNHPCLNIALLQGENSELVLKFVFKWKLKMQRVVIKAGSLYRLDHAIQMKMRITGLQTTALAFDSYKHAGQCTKGHDLSKLATIPFFLAKRSRQDHAGEGCNSLKYSFCFLFLEVTS